MVLYLLTYCWSRVIVFNSISFSCVHFSSFFLYTSNVAFKSLLLLYIFCDQNNLIVDLPHYHKIRREKKVIKQYPQQNKQSSLKVITISNNYHMLNLIKIKEAEKFEETAEEITYNHRQKRLILFEKLLSQSIQQFHELNIDDFDLNVNYYIEKIDIIGNQVTPLIYVAFFGLKDIMKFFLQNKKVDVDLETIKNKHTPLIVACLTGNYEIVRLLLLKNAEVNKPNINNHIPLTIVIFRLLKAPASFQNKKICFIIADLLIKNGADVDWIYDKKNGYSLLHYFCSQEMQMSDVQKQLNFEIINYLLLKGANPHLLTLKDHNCCDLIKNHCNKSNLLQLFEMHKQQQRKLKFKANQRSYKKIDANFFQITSPSKGTCI